jgi:formamidopyrimidine-DNA glycosylase
MPELPDVTVYVEHLEARLRGRTLERIRLASPFLLRTVAPPLEAFSGRRVTGVVRRGKRIVFAFAGGPRLALHLMIAGRLHWKPPGAPVPRGNGLMAMDFAGGDPPRAEGSLILTESGTKKRASLFAFPDAGALEAEFPVGLEPLDADLGEFAARLKSENHTLKRALTDPRLFSGIGNAYSDEILHRARLSPVLLTGKLADDQIAGLYAAVREVLTRWTDILRAEAGASFPEKVTAFRPQMAVHGKFGRPCPVCGNPVQRIRYAENETDYCPGCQTGGKLLADRALSSLLKKDWPRTLEEMEKMLARHKRTAAPPLPDGGQIPISGA